MQATPYPCPRCKAAISGDSFCTCFELSLHPGYDYTTIDNYAYDSAASPCPPLAHSTTTPVSSTYNSPGGSQRDPGLGSLRYGPDTQRGPRPQPEPNHSHREIEHCKSPSEEAGYSYQMKRYLEHEEYNPDDSYAHEGSYEHTNREGEGFRDHVSWISGAGQAFDEPGGPYYGSQVEVGVVSPNSKKGKRKWSRKAVKGSRGKRSWNSNTDNNNKDDSYGWGRNSEIVKDMGSWVGRGFDDGEVFEFDYEDGGMYPMVRDGSIDI